MSLWRISLSGIPQNPGPALGKFLVLSLFCCTLLSCGFLDLRPIGIRIFPGEPGTVLPEPYSPVILAFDTPMEDLSTERILRVSFNGGQVEGDLRWEGNALSFVPVAPWSAGIGYTLSLSGTVYAADGRELRLAKHIPFFARSRAALPYLSSFAPPEGASVGLIPNEGASVELHFSLPMDRKTTEDAFALNGIGEPRFTWQDDDRILYVDSEKPLSPWTVYRWNLSGKALSRDGAPLVKSASAWFTTDRDRLFPQVTRVYPVIRSGGIWVDTGDELSRGLGSGLALGLEFNKPMEAGETLRALRFEPSLAGHAEQLSPTRFVFIPDRDPEPETVYTLIVSGDVRDAGGLKMGTDYVTYFTPDLPYIGISSVTAGFLEPWEGEDLLNPHQVPIQVAENGVLELVIRFSLPFTTEARLDTALRISLDTFFPGKLPPVALRSAHWVLEKELHLVWEGLEEGQKGEAHYYRLTIPGGRNGIGNGRGAYLKETQYLYLEAVNEIEP
ncbi:MAG: Ig-like domain-containing protein [Treponema sp.]|jgi:hypothetical protein|nr:Ig-like domain-containing protein [Treponema sp.]